MYKLLTSYNECRTLKYLQKYRKYTKNLNIQFKIHVQLHISLIKSKPDEDKHKRSLVFTLKP